MKPRKTAELMASILQSGKRCGLTGKTIEEVKQETGFEISPELAVVADFPTEKPADSEEMVLACITYEPGERLVMPDNETGLCGWGCGRTVQYRPGRPAWLTKACLHCIDERPMKDHG